MNNNQSIKKNMFMNILLTSSNFIFPLITYSYVARILLPEGTGKVAFVQSVLAYFSYIATLGISGYGVRECAKIRDDKQALSKLVHELLTINLSSTIVAYIVLGIALVMVKKFQNYMSLFLIMSSGMLLQTLGVEWLYQALERYTYITIRSIIFKCISVVLTFFLIRDSGDYLIYGALTIFTSSASYILNFINARKYIEIRRYKEYNFLKHLQPIMVFFASSMIITIYGHFDSTMLGFMRGDSDVGIYNSALKMKSIVVSFSSGVTSVLVPRLSLYAREENRKKYLELLTKSLQVSCVLMLPVTMTVIFNAPDILEFVCGKEYLSATSTLFILMICSLVLCMTNLFGNQVLIPKGMEKYYSKSVFVGLFINLCLNALLIPRFGSAGAALATLATEIYNMMYMGYHARNEAGYLWKYMQKSKYFISLVLASIGEIILLHTTLVIDVVFFRLVINTIFFFSIYWISLLYMKEELVYTTIIGIRQKFSNRFMH